MTTVPVQEASTSNAGKRDAALLSIGTVASGLLAYAFNVLAARALAGSPAAAAEGTGPIEVGTEPIFTHPTFVGDVTYTPGRGLALGNTGLILGGYTNLTLTRNEGHDAKLNLQDLSVLILWRITQRLHVFSELEIEKPDREISINEACADSASSRGTMIEPKASFAT